MIESNLKLLGTRLVELRRAKGLSAAEVAEQALGYANGSHVAVTRLERAVLVRPSAQHLAQLATFYGVEPDFLFVGEAHSSPTEKAAPATKAAAPVGNRTSSRPAGKQPRELHERVTHVREAAGLDAAGFAAVLSAHGALITRSDVLAWEAGERSPNPIQLRALGRAADRDEAWFLTGAISRVEAPARNTSWVGASAAAVA